MNKYELTYLTTKEEGHDAASVSSILGKHKASITSVHPWGARRRLVYPIKKQDQAFYTTVMFEAEPSVVADIERHVRMSSEILRGLVAQYEPGYFDRTTSTDDTAARPTEVETQPEAVTAPADTAATVTTEEAPKPKRTTKKVAKETEDAAQDTKTLDAQIDELLKEDLTK